MFADDTKLWRIVESSTNGQLIHDDRQPEELVAEMVAEIQP
jgi:hypothetical protein